MIYICIPTHNEATTIGVLMWKARKVLGEFGRDYRFLVLDDASTDDTPDVLARYRRKLPLTVIRSDERLGYARAVERLLREAVDQAPYPKRDCAVVLQADFTENPDDVVSLVKVFEGGADIVAGCAPGTFSAPRAVQRVRRYARLAMGGAWGTAPVSDPLTGLRAYRIIVLKKALRELAEGEPLLRTEGWASSVELLGKLAPHARRIEESPLEPRYELQTRPSRLRWGRTLFSLFRLRNTRWRDGLEAEAS
ncbi:MAG: glycosyltransferase family 2 protein [Longimicrobiales bacterium]